MGPCAALLALLFALAAAPRPTAPVQQQVFDSGTFTLFLNDARIGEERFVIREERAGTAGPIYRAGAELNLKLDGRTMRVSAALETVGARCRPRRYELQVNGPEVTSITGRLVRERMRLDIRSPRGDEMKEFLVRGQAAILERHIAHLPLLLRVEGPWERRIQRARPHRAPAQVAAAGHDGEPRDGNRPDRRTRAPAASPGDH